MTLRAPAPAGAVLAPGSCPGCQNISHSDERIRHHAQSHPTLHPFEAAIAAATQSVPTLQHADTALTSRAPTLRVPEPTAVFLLFSIRTFCIPIRHRHPLHSLVFDCLLLRPRIVTRVRGGQVRRPSQHAFVVFHRP